MANRYWVGGSGTWNTTSTTNWSASSGGAGGASVPTTADSVFFDQAGTYTVTMTGALACGSFTVSAGAVTFQNGTTPTLTVANSWSTIAGTVWNTTGLITFTAGSIGQSITTGGMTFNSPITFNNASGSWILNDNLTLASTLTLTLTAGLLGLQSYTLTTGLFASSGSSTRTIAFSTGKIVLTSATTSTIWNTGTITGLAVTGTPLVECQGGGTGVTKTINTGALSEGNSISFSLLETSGTVTYTFTSGTSFRNLIFNGSQTISNIAVTIYGSFTHLTSNGTTTFTAGANAWTFGATASGTYTITPVAGFTYDFPWIFGSSAGSATFSLAANLTLGSTRTATLTSNTLALNSYTLTAGLFASSGTSNRTLNFGTGKIVLNSAATGTVWNTGTITGLTVSGTPLVECIGGGSAATKTINTGLLSEANAISFSLLETTGTVTYAFTASNVVKNLTINGVQTLSNIAITIYGAFTHSTANGTTTFTAGANAWTFAATSGSYTITNLAGTTYDFPWTFGSAASTATWTLAANLTLGATRAITLVNGTIDFNSKTLSAAAINITTGTPTIANTGTASFTTTLPILHASGTLTLPFNLTTSSTSGYTFTAGTLALGTYTLTTPVFASNNSNARTLNFGTGKIVLNGTATATIWNTATITNMTVSGTSLVECQGGGSSVVKLISAGALSEANAISFSLLETTGTVTYSFAANNTVKNLIINGLQTLSNIAITIYGAFTHSTANGTTTFTAGTNAWTFGATSGSYTITNLAATTYDFPWTFGSAASTATWTLAANLTLGATRSLTLVTGTFDFNSKTLSGAAALTFNNTAGTLTIANTGTASLSLTVAVTQAAGTVTLPFNLTTTNTSGFTLNGGTLALGTYTLTTPVFSSSNSTARTINFGTGKIVLNGTATATIWNTATITNLTISGTPLVECQGGGSAVTKTISAGTLSEASAISFSLLETTGTVTYAFTASNTVKNLIINGVQTLSNVAITIYGAFTHSTANGTTTFTAGTSAWTFAATSGSYTITNLAGTTYDFPWTFGTSTASTATWTLAANLTLGATRQITLVNGTTDFNSKTLSAAGITIATGTPTIANSGSSNFTTTLAFTQTGGTLTLPFNITSSGAGGYSITSTATLNLGSYTLTVTKFSCTTSSTTKTLNFGTGKIVLNGNVTATIFDTSNTLQTINISGTGLIECQGGGTGVTKTINNSTTNWGFSFSLLETTGTVTYAFTTNDKIVNLIINGSQTISNIALSMSGTFTHLTSNGTTTFTGGAAVWTFGGSGSYTINHLDSVTYDFPWTINCTGTYTLGANLTLGATRTLTLAKGTFDLNSKTVSAASLTIAGAASTAYLANTGSSVISITFPINHNDGALTLLTNLTTTSATGYYLSGSASGSATLTLNNYTLTTPTFGIGAALRSQTLDFGTSGQIVLTGSNATILSTTGGGTLTVLGTVYMSATYTGSTGTRTITTNSSDKWISIVPSGTSGLVLSPSSDTLTVGGGFVDINLTGFSGIFSNALRTIYGSLTLSPDAIYSSGTSTTTFGATSGTKTITTNGKTLDFPVTFNGAGGTWQLQDNMTLGTNRTLTHTNGTIDLNGKTLNVGTSYTTAVGTKNLTFNGGTLVCPAATTTAFNNAQPTNFTTTAGTGTGTISMTADTAKTFVGGGSTYNCTLSNDGAGALTITGSNTFTTIANGVSPTSFKFTAATTTTVTNWIVRGTTGNLVTIGSVTNATHTISKAAGIVSSEYLTISYSIATGGATWYAGASSTDGGNNSGWLFSSAPSSVAFFAFLMN